MIRQIPEPLKESVSLVLKFTAGLASLPPEVQEDLVNDSWLFYWQVMTEINEAVYENAVKKLEDEFISDQERNYYERIYQQSVRLHNHPFPFLKDPSKTRFQVSVSIKDSPDAEEEHHLSDLEALGMMFSELPLYIDRMCPDYFMKSEKLKEIKLFILKGLHIILSEYERIVSEQDKEEVQIDDKILYINDFLERVRNKQLELEVDIQQIYDGLH